jgi:hypothetical protein
MAFPSRFPCLTITMLLALGNAAWAADIRLLCGDVNVYAPETATARATDPLEGSA